MGFSEFARELARAGYTPVETVESFDAYLPGPSGGRPEPMGARAAASANGSLVVLNVAKRLSLSGMEQAGIVGHVRAGGSLLVFGEHDNTYGIADGLAPLLLPLGLALNRDAAGSRRAATRAASSPHFVLDGIVELLSASVRVLSGTAHDVLLASPDGTPLGVGVRFGAGRVVLIGDSELFWNGDARMGISAGRNRTFLRALLRYLGAPREEAGATHRMPGPRALTYAFGRGESVAYFDTSVSGLLPEVHPDGLSRLAEAFVEQGYRVVVGPADLSRMRRGDVRIVAAPFAGVVPNRFGSLLVLGAARHTLAADDFWGRVLLHRGAETRDSPYRLLERQFHFEFASCTQTDARGGSLLALPDHPGVRLHRAGGIRLAQGSATRVWHGMHAPPGARCFSAHPGIPPSDPASATRAESLPIAVAGRGLLLLSDAHALTNRYADTPGFALLVRKICTWLAAEKK